MNSAGRFLMKILLKKEVCRSRKQCTGPTNRHKHTTQALKTLSKLHLIRVILHILQVQVEAVSLALTHILI